jgi:hypothetical protein
MPIATRVPSVRRIVPISDSVQVGKAVASAQWSSLGELANYLRGHGVMIVPSQTPIVGADSTGGVSVPGLSTTVTIGYRVRPSGRAIARVWAFEVIGAIAAGGRGTITVNGQSVAVSAGNITADPNRVFVLFETATKTSSLTDLDVTMQATAGALYLTSVTCWELPRAQLTKDATDLGVDLGTLDPRRPILDRDYESVAGVCEALAGADGRRGTLVAWCGRLVETTSGSFVDVFELPARIVPPKVGYSDTTRTVSWSVYAACDVGTTGEAQVVDGLGGASTALSITSTTGAWLDGSKSFRCEDISQSNGLISGLTFETIQLQIRVASGAGKVYVTRFTARDDTW